MSACVPALLRTPFVPRLPAALVALATAVAVVPDQTTASGQSASPQTKAVATGMFGVVPVHWIAHRDVSKQVTEHSSAQLTVQSAPSLQIALPLSPRLI